MDQWTQHPQIPTALSLMQHTRSGRLMINFACQICGDQTQSACSGYPGMPMFRFTEYANMHRHGQYPVVPNRRPR